MAGKLCDLGLKYGNYADNLSINCERPEMAKATSVLQNIGNAFVLYDLASLPASANGLVGKLRNAPDSHLNKDEIAILNAAGVRKQVFAMESARLRFVKRGAPAEIGCILLWIFLDALPDAKTSSDVMPTAMLWKTVKSAWFYAQLALNWIPCKGNLCCLFIGMTCVMTTMSWQK